MHWTGGHSAHAAGECSPKEDLEVCYGVWVWIMGPLLCGGNFLPRQTEGYCTMVQRKVEELCVRKRFSCLNFLFHLFMKKSPYESLL